MSLKINVILTNNEAGSNHRKPHLKITNVYTKSLLSY